MYEIYWIHPKHNKLFMQNVILYKVKNWIRVAGIACWLVSLLVSSLPVISQH